VRLPLDKFDFQLEDNQSLSQIIWIFNPLRSLARVTNVKAGSGLLAVNRPWNIKVLSSHQDKLSRSKEAAGTDYELLSPADYWRVESNQKKPVGEFSFVALHAEHTSRLLLMTEVTINVTQTLPTVGTEINKELVFPVRIFKTSSHQLVQEEYIDMGLITSPEVAHRYNFQIHNKFGRPVVITRIAIDKKEINMNLKVATIFGYRIAVPSNTQPFTLLTLLVTGVPSASLGSLSGSIHIYLNVNGNKEKVVVPFHCSYYKNAFGDEDRFSFQLNRTRKDGRIVNKITATMVNNFGSELVLRNAVFNDIEHNEDTINFISYINHRRVENGASVPALAANFRFPDIYFDNMFAKGHELVTIFAFNSASTLLLKYYALALMCGYHATFTSQYEKCKPVEKIDFGFIALNNRKVVTIDIYNPTMVSFIIRRVEFSDNKGNVEVSFENQSKWGIKSNFRKTSRSINTFVLIAKGDVISMRIKIKPVIAGNYKEMITVITNHGDYSFAISYKGIQGEILFTPTTLRYDLFYPIEGDEKSVVAKNKFNIDVEVHSAWSPQPFIFTHLKTQYLKQNSKENFLGVILDLTDDDLIDPDRSGFLSTIHEKYVAVSDLVAYEDQQRGWDKILKEAKTEINGEVIVQTDCLDNLKINVKGHLRKALFLPEEKLVFGPLEEKRSHRVNVTITNPTQRDVSMRFYLADSRLLELKSIHKKIVNGLMKRYSKFREEHICISHPTMEEDILKFYAEAFFEKVVFKTDVFKKNSQKKVCFVVNHPRPSHSKFFSYKGNYLFNVSRHSRMQMIKDNLNVYLLKDIIRLSNKKPPRNAQSLYGLSLYQKLKLMAIKGLKVLHQNIHKKRPYKNTSDIKYVSNLKPSVINGILKKQEFFISRRYRNKEVTIPAGKSVTIPLLICYPRESPEGQMNLLIKNDYSKLIILPISAQLGKISLIVHKRIYVNEGGATTSIVQKKEEYNKMIYNIHSADLIQKIGRESKKYVFKQNVKRIFEFKNNGNLPIKVNTISVENQGCSFNGFEISNCQGFELQPSQIHKIEVKLLHTYNFQAELKKEVYFLMDSRVLVFEFEVTSNDPLMPELASFGFVTSITQVFRLVAFIFFCILVLVLLRHYHEKPSELSYCMTDVDKDRFGTSYFHNNIGDLKLLEEQIKFQKFEHQKHRHLRNLGVKQLIHQANVASSRDTSMNAIGSDIEGFPISSPGVHDPHHQELDVPENIIDEKPEPLLVKPSGKKKKGRKQVQPQVHEVKQIPQPRNQQQLPALGNILDNIDLEKPTYKSYEPQPSDSRDIGRKPTSAKKESPASTRKRSIDSKRQIYQEDIERHRPDSEQKLEIDNKKGDSSYANKSKDSRYSRHTGQDQSAHQMKPKSALSKKSADPSVSHHDPEEKREEKSEVSVRQRTGSEQSYDVGDERWPEKTSSRASLRKGSSSFHVIDKSTTKTGPENNHSRHNENDYYKEAGMIDRPSSHERTESRLTKTNMAIENKRKDAPPGTRYEKESKLSKKNRREPVYYQRIEKQEDEFPSLTPYQRKDSDEYHVKSKPTEELYIVKKKEPSETDQQQTPSVKEPSQRSANVPLRLTDRHGYQGKGGHNRSFSQDVRDENREDQVGQHNLSGFDNNISHILKMDEPDQDLSGIGILKETAEYRGKQRPLPEISPEHSESDASVENNEKSHERIRNLLEDTEEVKPETLSPRLHYKEGKQVVGVIGEKATKKHNLNQRGPSHQQGSSFLGFRNSSNTNNQNISSRTYNQFSNKEQEPKPNMMPGPMGLPIRTPNPYFGPQSYGFSEQYQPTATFGMKTSVISAQPLRQNFGGERAARSPMQVTVHSNQYGSFVPKDQIFGLQAGGHGYRPEMHYQHPYGDQAGLQPPYGEQGAYESEEDNYSQEYNYNQAYEQDEHDYYQDLHPDLYPVHDASFGQQPFKAAIRNNPFTLSRIASSQREGPGVEGWHKGYEEQGDQDFEGSRYSGSSYNMSRGVMRPPPGLTEDFEEQPVYRHPHGSDKPLHESKDNSRFSQESRRLGKKND
jgi:hypothetical protein